MADADVQVHHRDLLMHSLPLTFFTISIDTDSKKNQWDKFSDREQVPVNTPGVIQQFIFYFNQYINKVLHVIQTIFDPIIDSKF